MYNQQSSQKLTSQDYVQLDQESPQLKAYLQEIKVGEFQLQTHQRMNLKSMRKRKSKRLEQIETNLIKIKPIYRQQQQGEKINKVLQIAKPKSQKNQCGQAYFKQNFIQYQFNRQNRNAIKGHEISSTNLYENDVNNDHNQNIQFQRQYQISQSSQRQLNKKQRIQKTMIKDSQNQKIVKYHRDMRLYNKYGKNKLVNKSQHYQEKRENQIQNNENKQQFNNESQIYEYEQQKQQVNSQQQKNQDGFQQEDNQYLSSLQKKQQQNQSQENSLKKDQLNNIQINNNKPSSFSAQIPQLVVLKSNSFYTLINAQIPKGSFVNCVIKRKRLNNKNTFFNLQTTVIYEMFLLEDKKFIMSSVKNRLLNVTSHFEFYRQKFTTKHNFHQQNLYAILDSNFTGTEFVLKTIVKNDTFSQRSTTIDKSDIIKADQSTTAIGQQSLNYTKNYGALFKSQNKIISKDNQFKKDSIQIKQSCFITFKANFFGLAGQRQVKILKKKNKKIKKTYRFSDIKQAYQRGQIDKVLVMNNKKAIYGKNGFQLDFKSYAKLQSTKNIILQNELGKQALIFGKIKQEIYSVSIGYPLSIVEGLAFGIANLDRKFFVN